MPTPPIVAYIHRFLRCPNSHAIPLPRPSHIERDDNLQEKAMENRRAVFVCPHCGLVSAYYGQDIVEQMAGTPTLFQLEQCSLVSIEIECDGKNCEALKVVHTIAGIATGTWTPKVVPRDWQFSESARCGAGHKLRFDESRGLHLQSDADFPF
jgi:hypothetical protein